MTTITLRRMHIINIMSNHFPAGVSASNIISNDFFLHERTLVFLSIESMISHVQVAIKELTLFQEEVNKMEIPVDAKLVSFFQLKTLDYGIMSHQAALHWLNHLYQELKSQM